MTVGVQGDAASENHNGESLSVGEVASMNELGIGVPERSFLRAWFDENKAMIERDLQQVIKKTLRAQLTIDEGLSLLGAKYVGSIQRRISSGIPPENAELTIELKGSSIPLIDTGQLRSAITWMLEGKAQEK